MCIRDRVWGGEEVWLEPVVAPDETCQPQDLPLDIVFEDEAILVINKPAGLVVHPAAGNPDGTLQNALLHHAPEPVSYTHLDVYKRQIEARNMWLIFCQK